MTYREAPPVKERTIESFFCERIKPLGGVALKLELAGQRGFPDRTVLVPGSGVVFVEFKTPRGRLSSQQRRWLDALTARGYRCEVIDTIEGAESLATDLSDLLTEPIEEEA